jgi:hypothetical protein
MAALWGGLVRLGWALPPPPGLVAIDHGPLMVSGFLGTLIGLERAAALGLGWPYVAPFATGLGALALVSGLPAGAGPLLVTVGSAALVAVFVLLVRRQPEPFQVVMGLGALAWLGGNLLWLAGWPVPRLVLAWVAFLVLTIAGERLELTRLFQLPASRRAVFLAGAGSVLAAPALSGLGVGYRTSGLGLLVLSPSGSCATTSRGGRSASRACRASWPPACSRATSGS